MRTNKIIATATLGAGLLVGSIGLAGALPMGTATAQTPTTAGPVVGAGEGRRERAPDPPGAAPPGLGVAAAAIGVTPADLGPTSGAGSPSPTSPTPRACR